MALHLFTFARPTPVPSHTLVIYGALLLLASLQTAAARLDSDRLRRVLTKASAGVLVRIQHIVCADAARHLGLPLQLHMPRMCSPHTDCMHTALLKMQWRLVSGFRAGAPGRRYAGSASTRYCRAARGGRCAAGDGGRACGGE